MCGIVGAITQRDVVDILLAGLHRLEYRGYDSAGVAVINDSEIQRVRCKGKVADLEGALNKSPLTGTVGIAHTRWATHGVPNEKNAHPHTSHQKIAIVHNGIIENNEELKKFLLEKGYQFDSDTDSEAIAHLIDYEWGQSPNETLAKAIQKVAKRLDGAYAIGVIHSDEPDRIYAVRHGSPLVVGLGVGEYFIASDMLALIPLTQQFIYLEDGDIADISKEGYTIFNKDGVEVEREVTLSKITDQSADRGNYRHYMLKEIFEQPQAIYNTFEGRIDNHTINLDELGSGVDDVLKKCESIHIIACGTSYHAGLVASHWFEEWAGVPCRVDIASEQRYRRNIVPKNSLLITVSQSGETADTLAALRNAMKQDYLSSLAICNVDGSSLVRESDMALLTKAGPEIGVASTKAFTTQLAAFMLIAAKMADLKKEPWPKDEVFLAVGSLPQIINEVLSLDEKIQILAEEFVDKDHAIFLGRGAQFPLALEGALKLKEISYIHAEAYPAGELKHGPLALVDKQMPVVVLAPNNNVFDKICSNIREVEARGGQLYVFSDEVDQVPEADSITSFALPKVSNVIAPIVYTIPMQLLSYHVAVLKGTDVDRPRNLAKSVTVE